MALRDSFLPDMQRVFCNTDDFAELIVYEKSTGARRTINAVVVRGDITGRQEVLHGVSRTMRVHVANDATTGVSATEIDDTDALWIPWEPNGIPAKFMIVSVPVQDAGGLMFRFGAG